jgi:hypothetical protein
MWFLPFFWYEKHYNKNNNSLVKSLVNSQVFNYSNNKTIHISGGWVPNWMEKVKRVANKVIGYRNWIGRAKRVANKVIGYRNWIGRAKRVANRGYWLPRLDRKSKTGSQ